MYPIFSRSLVTLDRVDFYSPLHTPDRRHSKILILSTNVGIKKVKNRVFKSKTRILAFFDQVRQLLRMFLIAAYPVGCSHLQFYLGLAPKKFATAA